MSSFRPTVERIVREMLGEDILQLLGWLRRVLSGGGVRGSAIVGEIPLDSLPDHEHVPGSGSGSAPTDAGEVGYTPTTGGDWPDPDPSDVQGALDGLASRVQDLEDTPPGTPDASEVPYTPTTATDWDGDADPGDVDNALDQLAERVDDLEGAGPGGGATDILQVQVFS